MIATFLSNLRNTVVAGFVLGAASGFATGFALGRNDLLARILDPYITAIYCLPKIALAPLFLLLCLAIFRWIERSNLPTIESCMRWICD